MLKMNSTLCNTLNRQVRESFASWLEIHPVEFDNYFQTGSSPSGLDHRTPEREQQQHPPDQASPEPVPCSSNYLCIM